MMKLKLNKLTGKNLMKVAATLMVVVGCLTALGCSDSKQEKTAAKPTAGVSENKTIYPFEAVTELKDDRKNIYVALKVVKGDYWQELVRGLKDSGEAAGVNVYVGGPAIETDWKNQKDMLDSLAAKKVDAVIMSPCDSDNMIPVVSQLKEKRLPVILVDTRLNDKVYDAAYMTDNVAAGGKAAAEMLNILRKQGVKEDTKLTIAIAAASFNSRTLLDRAESVKKYWAKNAPANWSIKPEALINYSDPQLAQNLAAEAVKKDASIKGFISVNNSSTVNTCKFLLANKDKNLCIVGFDYSKEIASLIADSNNYAASVVQNQYNMGYEAVKTATQMLKGQKPSAKDFDTGIRIINAENFKEFEKQAKAN